MKKALKYGQYINSLAIDIKKIRYIYLGIEKIGFTEPLIFIEPLRNASCIRRATRPNFFYGF